MIKSVIVILICVTIKSRMYCQQYLFLTTFLIIVPFPSHGRYSSKPSPRCAVGRAYNAKAELGKVYCGAHVIGCRLTVTSNVHHLGTWYLSSSFLCFILELKKPNGKQVVLTNHHCGPPFNKRFRYTYGCEKVFNKKGVTSQFLHWPHCNSFILGHPI